MIEDGVSNVAYFRLDGGSSKLYTQEYVDKKDKEIERLNKELEFEKLKNKEVREYLTGYESVNVLQSLDNIDNNIGLDRDTMIEMMRRYLIVHDKVLEILDKENKNN